MVGWQGLAVTKGLVRAKKGLRAGGVVGGRSFEPPGGGGGGSGKGALVTGQSKEARPKPLMMTHHLRREAARKNIFQKKVPHDTYLKMITALWGCILSHMCWGTLPPPCRSPPLVVPRGGVGDRHLVNPKFFVAAHCVVVWVAVLWGTTTCIPCTHGRTFCSLSLKWNLTTQPCFPLGQV